MTNKYAVEGMSCAACATRVERAVSSVEGVTGCTVSLLTNSMTVEGNAEEAKIITAVERAGYKIKKTDIIEEKTRDNEVHNLLKRLTASLLFLAALMYASMGHTMWSFPMPALFANNPLALGILQLSLSAAVLVINRKFFISGFKGLFHGSPNMDTLISLGSLAAFVYSTYILCLMPSSNNPHHLVHDLYFESAAMILALVTVGKMLEAYSKGKTTNALRELINLTPKTACVMRNGKEIIIPAEQVEKGDIFILRPGDAVAADGKVIKGSSAINEAALTGESTPCEKEEGDLVFSGTINLSGYLECEAQRVAQDTILAEIIETVKNAASSKAPIAKIADKVSGIFVPIVVTIAAVTAFLWLVFGQTVGFSLTRAISVLVISCPCALGLATPVAILVGSGRGAKLGILFKNAQALENAGRINTVVLDKTGTITEGQPSVTDIVVETIQEDELLRFAAALEHSSEHPLAKAVMKKAEERNISYPDVTDFLALQGNGVQAEIAGKKLIGGSYKFISTHIELDESTKKTVETLSASGKTPLLFALEGRLLGIIAVADTVRTGAAEAVKQLQKMGISVAMLTGDNKFTAEYVAKLVGIENVIAEVHPTQKAQTIEKIKKSGKVAMVGDGINDAPALTVADVGIAIGKGTNIAIDSADIVLRRDSLAALPRAIALSRATLRTIKQNLFWAFFYNILSIPIAAGVFINSLGWQLSPMFAAAAMSLSSICVVANAIRLSRVKLFKGMEIKDMIKNLKIDGMMCPHCEKRVKSLLEALPEISSAEVSYEKGTAQIKLNSDITDEALKKVIEAEGYKVL